MSESEKRFPHDWILVTSELPTREGCVLAYVQTELGDDFIETGYFAPERGFSDGYDFRGTEVTHWMTLPAKPIAAPPVERDDSKGENT